MPKLSITKGATSVIVRVFIQDKTSTTGAGLTGLVYNTSGLTCYRMRDDDGNAAGTQVTLATMTRGTWASAGFVEKDSTNCPGWYEFGVPNAALATGTRSVDFHFQGAANMAPCPVEIELTGWDNQSTTDGGLSKLTSLTFTVSNKIDANVYTWNGTAVVTPATAGVPDVNAKNINNVSTSSVTTINANVGTTQPTNFTGTGASAYVQVDVIDWHSGAVPAPNVTGVPLVDLKYTLGTISPAAAGSVSIDWAHVVNPTSTVGLTNTTISTTQAVASVSGAVGSVTGSVGSVTAAVTLSAGDSPVLQSGTAAAGGATSITLASAVGADSRPVGCLVKIIGGTGAGQCRVVTAYVDSTKVCTVDRAWATNPDATSVYAVLYNEATALSSGLKVTEVSLVDTLTTYTSNTPQSGDVYGQLPAHFSALGITAGGKVSEVVLCDTITTYTGDTPQTGDSYARIGATGSGLTSLAPASTALSTATWTGALAAALTTLAGHDPGATLGTSTLTAAQVLTTALTESYAAVNAAPTLSQAIFELISLLSNRSISGTTMTCQKLDGATASMTFTLNSATTPTSQVRAS